MQTVEIQNENQPNTTLNFKGDLYKTDEKGVMRCSKLVAEMLLSTPHWHEYTRDFANELDGAKNQVLACESEFRRAKEALNKANENLERIKREAEAEARATAPEPVKAEEPSSDAEAEEPSEAWTKDRLLAYAHEYEVELPSTNPTKAEILTAINEQLEDE